MITAVAFALAAAVGALVRAEAGRRWNRAGALPLGTLLVNVAGSFLLGLLAGVAGPTVTVLGVGGLGAATTFSGFAGEVVALGEARRHRLALVYVVATYVPGIAAAALGVAVEAALTG